MLFCDLVGSTALSTRLDPEDLRELIRRYHDACAVVIARYGGHLAKLLGDGVLAHFGHPQAHEDDAERAVRTGLELVGAVAGLAAPGGPALRARIGIATGPVVVGDTSGGEGGARERDAVGETPNLAARLQALAEPGTVVVGAGTRRLVAGLFDLAELGARELKGFAAPVPTWRVLGPSRAAGRFEAREAASGLTPLVGRAPELALLLDRWGRARDGEGQLVLLGGEPGVGKSRLVRALRERLGGAPHTVLAYQCSPLHADTALHPVVAQIERAASFGPDDEAGAKLDKLEALLGPGAADAAAVAPLFAELLSIPTGGRYPPLDLQRRSKSSRSSTGRPSRWRRRQSSPSLHGTEAHPFPPADQPRLPHDDAAWVRPGRC